MTNASSYDQFAYDSHAFADTHPNRLGALARLHGIKAAAPDTARVLELGCASGGNIIPMAVRAPQARFVGIDYSQQQIAAGKTAVRGLGIDNIELRCESILDLDQTLGKFDYIIAHGVYSWVPAEVQDKLLKICRAHLAANGVAFVSYNTFPGWHLGGAVRYMMQYHSAAIADPEDKVRAAKGLLKSLAQITPATGAYASMLKEYSELLEKAPAYYVFHEHLEDNNRPVYFNQFVDHAHRAGLAYLCDGNVVTGLSTPFSNEANEFVLAASRGNLIDFEQYLDFVSNRKFRQSLLVHQESEITRNFGPTSLNELVVAADVQSMGQGSAGMQYSIQGQTLASNSRFFDRALLELQRTWPEGGAVQKIIDNATRAESGAGDLTGKVTELANLLLELTGRHAVDLLLAPWPSQSSPSADEVPPCSDPYSRYQADGGKTLLVNKAHRSVTVSGYLRDVLVHLDGKRNLAGVAEEIARGLKSRGQMLETQNGRKVSDLAQMRQIILDGLPKEINLLKNNLLLR